MYRTSAEIKAELNKLGDEIEALATSEIEGAEDKILAANDQAKLLEKEYEDAVKFEKAKAEIAARRERDGLAGRQPHVTEDIQDKVPKVKLPAVARAHKSRHFDQNEDAYVAGMYFAHLAGNQKAGEILAAQSVGTDSAGGFTVPDPLSASLINLLETRGVARAKCRRIVMSALTQAFPKLTGHATVYYPAEAASITASDLTFAQVTLTAKKIAALVKMSTEISEDSVISMVDTIVESIAYSVATAEDNNLFNGVASAINADGIKSDTDVSEVAVASVAALALTSFTAASVAIGNPIIGAVNEWYMNPTLYHGKVRDLVNAAGGNTIMDYEGGQRPMLLGYPVNFVNVLPGNSASTSNDLLAVFGDLSMACYFGDRRQWSFKILNELYAENDQVGVIGTERIDIQVVNPELLSKITIT